MTENPSLTLEIQKFYAELQKSFANIFARQRCRQDIAEVIETLEQKRPIADLLESHRGSFSTIFVPFHSGDVRFQTIAKNYSFHSKLLEFCTLAGTIESLTDTMSITGEEPSEKDKAKLLPLLKTFLAILPSSEAFESWLK
ncbi:MAG: hypothetical protein WC353_04235 [Candidatus Peribacter sp.]|jgi:hypothetical protein